MKDGEEASLKEQITSTIIGRLAPPLQSEIRSRIVRQQQRIVAIGEQIGVLMLALEVEEDFMAELLVLEESEFEEREEAERNKREECEAEEHEQAMVDRANAHVDPEP